MDRRSDDRAQAPRKSDIRCVGYSPSGIPVYTFRYHHDAEGRVYQGALAPDLVKTHPWAVHRHGQHYMIDYEQIDVVFKELGTRE